MKLLITAATYNELLAAQEIIGTSEHQIVCGITGIGVAATAYHTTKLVLTESFDLAINIGIAGSYTDLYPIGTVVSPVKEYFGDSGIQTPAGFSSLFDEKLLSENTFPFVDGALKNNLSIELSEKIQTIPQVTGLTVQMASGQQQRIDELQKHFDAVIETMESAAFFYVCLSQKLPFIALRAVSNKVEVRNKEAWNIPIALQNLQNTLKQFLANL